jgi:DNA polymerase III alpha subunit
VRGLREAAASRIEEERARAPFGSLQDFVDRTGLKRDEQRRLAEVGALNAFGLTRRSALWQVEKAGARAGRSSARSSRTTPRRCPRWTRPSGSRATSTARA